MNPPWTLQLASDIVRDGLGLELLDGSGRLAAEVFRCDADHSVAVRVFEKPIPNDVFAELVAHARECLGSFEDGTPLPFEFEIEPDVRAISATPRRKEKAEFWAEVEIEISSVEAVDRSAPLDLRNDRPGQYRPHLRVIGGSGTYLGVAFMDRPDEPVSPGRKTPATVKALDEPAVSHAGFVVGARFEILEGSRGVGQGRVPRIAD